MANPAKARETFVALRHAIAKIEGRLAERLEDGSLGDDGLDHAALPPEIAARLRQPTVSTGVEGFDAALGGGLPFTGLTEIHSNAARDGSAAVGFALALAHLVAGKEPAPLLWVATAEIMREIGRPYVPGLATRFSIETCNLLISEAVKAHDALWIAEEAANTGGFRALIIELRGSPRALDLTATRRLHRRAVLAGLPIFLILHAGHAQPTAAPLRLLVQPVRAGSRQTISGPLHGSIGPPAFAATITKSRNAATTSAFTLDWIENVFRERTAHPRLVVPLPRRRASTASPERKIVEFPAYSKPDTNDLQPPREQQPARRGAG